MYEISQRKKVYKSVKLSLKDEIEFKTRLFFFKITENLSFYVDSNLKILIFVKVLILIN